MPNSSQNRRLEVRLTPLKKQVLMSEANNNGSNASDLVQGFVDWWLGLTDELPERNPNVAARVRTTMLAAGLITDDLEKSA